MSKGDSQLPARSLVTSCHDDDKRRRLFCVISGWRHPSDHVIPPTPRAIPNERWGVENGHEQVSHIFISELHGVSPTMKPDPSPDIVPAIPAMPDILTSSSPD